MKKFKVGKYRNQRLPGRTVVTRKIDGVRAERKGIGTSFKRILSRRGKPLYNIPPYGSWTIAEVFLGTWEATVSAVRTNVGGTPVPRDCIYELAPELDPRLIVRSYENITPEDVKREFDLARKRGDEGLVLYHAETNRTFKVVSRFTYDVLVTAAIEGRPGTKYVGMLGAVVTSKGKVGAGFSDAERLKFWRNKSLIVGEKIEVACKGLTPRGKFREPRFERVRWDK